jgi:hypothetical protein
LVLFKLQGVFDVESSVKESLRLEFGLIGFGFLSRFRSVQLLHQEIEGPEQLAELNFRHGLLPVIVALRATECDQVRKVDRSVDSG